MFYLDQIRSYMSQLRDGGPVYLGDPPDSIEPPYAFVWAQPPTPHGYTLAGRGLDIDERVNITVVDITAKNVMKTMWTFTEALHGAKVFASPPYSEGDMRVVDTSRVMVDKSVRVTRANKFPHYGVLTVRVRVPRMEDSYYC